MVSISPYQRGGLSPLPLTRLSHSQVLPRGVPSCQIPSSSPGPSWGPTCWWAQLLPAWGQEAQSCLSAAHTWVQVTLGEGDSWSLVMFQGPGSSHPIQEVTEGCNREEHQIFS